MRDPEAMSERERGAVRSLAPPPLLVARLFVPPAVGSAVAGPRGAVAEKLGQLASYRMERARGCVGKGRRGGKTGDDAVGDGADKDAGAWAWRGAASASARRGCFPFRALDTPAARGSGSCRVLGRCAGGRGRMVWYGCRAAPCALGVFEAAGARGFERFFPAPFCPATRPVHLAADGRPAAA
jgi:hypothetical protein